MNEQSAYDSNAQSNTALENGENMVNQNPKQEVIKEVKIKPFSKLLPTQKTLNAITLDNDNEESLLNEIELSLSSALQSSINTQIQLETIFRHLSTLVGITGVSFEGDSGDFSSLCGSSAKHEYSYQLYTGKAEVGELVCFSQNALEGINKKIIDLAAKVAIFPLYHGLLYQEAIEASHTDTLTEVPNRRAFNRSLEKVMANSKRYNRPFCLLIIDIDNFKIFNDRWGHCVGDDVLKAVVKILTENIRECDSIFRFGGEEFILLLNDTKLNGAKIVADRLCQAVREYPFKVPDEKLNPQKLSISIGCTEFTMKDSKESLIERADSAVYHAKAAGRDRCCCAK